jgi:hypothetical protein
LSVSLLGHTGKCNVYAQRIAPKPASREENRVEPNRNPRHKLQKARVPHPRSSRLSHRVLQVRPDRTAWVAHVVDLLAWAVSRHLIGPLVDLPVKAVVLDQATDTALAHGGRTCRSWPFTGIVRNQNHDNFGLAVPIFLMLFMGRHPFAGRYLGSGEMPIPRAIKECRFAYGARRANVQMEKPPGTPSLSIVGDEIGFMFERAFAGEMIAGGRPLPRDWIEGLERL